LVIDKGQAGGTMTLIFPNLLTKTFDGIQKLYKTREIWDLIKFEQRVTLTISQKLDFQTAKESYSLSATKGVSKVSHKISVMANSYRNLLD